MTGKVNLGNYPFPPSSNDVGPLLHLVVRVDRNGDERAHGVLAPGGRRSDVLVAEPDGTQASCADIDDDGVAGLTLIVAAFSFPRTGERLVATMVPQNGEIDAAGWHPMTIHVAGTSFEGRAAVFPSADSAGAASG